MLTSCLLTQAVSLGSAPSSPLHPRRAQTHLSPILTTGRRLPASTAINPVHGLTDLYQGMVVGQVLGQGSYGTVYHGKWHGVDVAIKVRQYGPVCVCRSQGASQEACRRCTYRHCPAA